MQKSQKGFTLIELIVVMVLLGILGVTALGKYQNMSTAARDATLNGVASEVTSGSNINYASFLAGGTATAIAVGSACATVVDALLTGGLPTGYTGSAGNTTCGAAGAVDTTCTVTHADATAPVAVTLICTAP